MLGAYSRLSRLFGWFGWEGAALESCVGEADLPPSFEGFPSGREDFPSFWRWNQVLSITKTIRNFEARLLEVEGISGRNLLPGLHLSSSAALRNLSSSPSRYCSTFMWSLSMTLPSSLLGLAAEKYILMSTITAYAARTKWKMGRHRTTSTSRSRNVSKMPSTEIRHAERASMWAAVRRSDSLEFDAKSFSSVNGGLNSSTL